MTDDAEASNRPWLRLRQGVALSVRDVARDLQRVTCSIEGLPESEAVVYTTLVGEVHRFDRLLLNTTAVDLCLGSGGRHFVVANLTRPSVEPQSPSGQVVKARYTPLQCVVETVEESGALSEDADSLSGTPVVCCELLSQAFAAIAGCRFSSQPARVALVVTDEAALPIAFSDNLRRLRAIAPDIRTISSGQAYGGDLETVNLHSGLLSARFVAKADVIVVTPGPGTVGTGTRWGFGGVAQGEAINAAYSLGGLPIGVIRASSADPRPRHRGISHHTRTVFSRVALCSFHAAWPAPTGDPFSDDWRRLQELCGVRMAGHVIEDAARVLDTWDSWGFTLSSMGRGRKSDPLFFEAATAAGLLAAQLAQEGKRDS